MYENSGILNPMELTSHSAMPILNNEWHVSVRRQNGLLEIYRALLLFSRLSKPNQHVFISQMNEYLFASAKGRRRLLM
ncbi:hypothetical protein, partial [Paraburkholderia nemoris]|uniref:hypothetical protein n=1 Tax=Paraburkholderia nemoris TaxID=2793076 RepID=UPI001B8B3D22